MLNDGSSMEIMNRQVSWRLSCTYWHMTFFQYKDATEKIKLDKGVTLAKCCPIGEIFQLNGLGGGETCSKSETSWKIQINGTSYNSTDLIDKKILVYDDRSEVSKC